MQLTMQYFPVIVCAEYDSPIDALVSLCIPHDEAMNLVSAFWRAEQSCIVATIDGGRHVAVMRLAEGRWAACNAFLDDCCATPGAAERQLNKLLKRGRRGYVLALQQALLPQQPQ